MIWHATARFLTVQPLQAPAAGGQNAPAGNSLDATDTVAARGHLGEFVEIKGTPTGTGASKSGTTLYLNFTRQRGSAVTVVFFLPKGNATPSNGAGTRPASVENLKQFVGKPVTVKGQLSDYQGDVQMVVPYLEQIKVQ